MTIEQHVCSIESPEFAVDIGCASDWPRFKAIVSEHTETRNLIDAIAGNASAQRSILRRVQYLSDLATDYRYQNPYDPALAVYVTVLGWIGDDATAIMAARIGETAERCWWTPVAADAALKQPRGGQSGVYTADAEPVRSFVGQVMRSLLHAESSEQRIRSRVCRTPLADSSSVARGDGVRSMTVGPDKEIVSSSDATESDCVA